MSRRICSFFMFKKFILILLLTLLNLYSYQYLKSTLSNQNPFFFIEDEQSYFYQKKNISLMENEEFRIDDYFGFFGLENPSYKYKFEGNNLILTINDKKYFFDYELISERQNEIEDGKEEAIKEESKTERNNNHQSNNTANNQNEPEQPKESNYFHIKKDYYSFKEGTDIGEIIAGIGKAVDSNQKLIVDYSSLNPNEKGIYNVYFASDDHKATIIVEIV